MGEHPIIITFVLAVGSFYINHRIKRAIEIKVLINTLWDIFGCPETIEDHDPIEVSKVLMNEIINLEKLHDGNRFVEKETKMLGSLRNLWFRLGKGSLGPIGFTQDLNKIPRKKLGIAFVLLVFFNPET